MTRNLLQSGVIPSGFVDLTECENWHLYLKRYKKSPLARLKRFKLEDKQLAIRENEVSLIKRDILNDKSFCVFNSNSYLNKTIENEKNVKFISEAQFKTYPSKKLKREVFKHLESVLQPWQLESTITIGSQEHNLLDFYYQEYAFNSDDPETRIAGNIQLSIPVKDPHLKGQSSRQVREFVEKSICRPFKLFGYDLTSMDIADYDFDVKHNSKLLSWVKNVVLFFEARFQESQFKLNKFLYHAAPANKRSKIMKNGLMAKSSSNLFDYPDRVYMFNTDDMSKIANYTLESGKKNVSGKGLQNDDWILVQIDPALISNLKLYVDTNDDSTDMSNPNAVFTYQDIPSSAIVSIKDFNAKDFI